MGLLLGVLEPLLEPLKSNRIRRTVPRVNCSRQNGQTGDRREEVFSRMVLQQFKHNTCPERGEGGLEKIFRRQNKGKTDRMEYNGVNYEDQTLPRKRRTESQALA